MVEISYQRTATEIRVHEEYTLDEKPGPSDFALKATANACLSPEILRPSPARSLTGSTHGVGTTD